MYHLVDEMDPNEGIEPYLDTAAGQWDVRIANELNDLAWKCLNSLKDRPTSDKVHIILKKLHMKVAQN